MKKRTVIGCIAAVAVLIVGRLVPGCDSAKRV